MAKTIKFNLICDENPVRTIEDLQNNFSIEDVLAYYKNRLLHRWLRVRGYEKELEAVSAITSTSSMDIIKELIQIFEITVQKEKVEEAIFMLQYLEERKELCSIYEQENYKAAHIIEDYEAGYRQLVDEILEYPDNVAAIKACIAEIVSNYAWILKLNHRNLFYSLRLKSDLAIMCLLMNEKSRGYFLPTEKEKVSSDKKRMFDCICDAIKRSDFVDSLGTNIISFSGVTDGYWKDLEPKGRRFMIVSMESGDFVRPAGVSGGDLGSEDVKNKFVIVDGIDYKSNSDTHKLLYMEV